MQEGPGERRALSVLILPAFLFILALLPRLLALDAFLTPDEGGWVRRSRDFLAGVLRQDWTATLQTGHPGVTTMWTGSMGILYKYLTRPASAPDDLLTFVQRVPSDPIHLSYVAPVRFPTVVLTALSVAAFFWLAARLFDRRGALISGCLFALNPFHIALSRVLHHDALATTFMTLSLLPMLGYWLHRWGRRWLLISGVMAGLAFLSKSSAMLLMPFCALVGVWTGILRWRGGERRIGAVATQTILDGVLWGAVAWLTYGLVWPAMWVQPVATLASVFNFVSEQVNEAHLLGQFFMGGYVQDSGPLFYPLIWLLRTTPLHLLGLAGLLISAGGRSQPHPPSDARKTISVYLCIAYVLLNAALLTLGAKKQERYILIVFPVIDLLAGLGLVRLWQILGSQWQGTSRLKRWVALRWPKGAYFTWPAKSHRLLTAVVIVVQALFVLPHHPYYFTYYDPLLGGGRTAVRWVGVGWGEGLDLAAAFLNQKPDASHLTVTAWYDTAFAPYFQGQTIQFFTTGKHMSSDYLVFYQNQLQRQMPDPPLLAYYQRHYTPEYVVRLKGIDYALVYAVPVERRTDWQASQVPGKLILYGYRQGDTQPDVLTMRLVWENRGMAAQDGLWTALELFEGFGQPAANDKLIWQPCQLAPGFSPAEVQVIGGLAESECQLYTRDLKPGIYSFHIGLGPAPQLHGTAGLPGDKMTDLLAPAGELGVSVPDAGTPSLIASYEALDAMVKKMLPPGALPLHVSFDGRVALIGYEIASSTPQPYPVTVRLYWRALQDLPQPANLADKFRVRFDFVAPDGRLIAAGNSPLFNPAEPGEVWRSGQVLANSHQVAVPEGLPPGDYRLAIAVTNADTGQAVPALDEATGILSTTPLQLETGLAVQ